jgi:molybdenum cofactor cytidylyltransferase
VVVLGSNEQEHRKILKDLPIEIVSNPDWKSGMGSSLKAGLKHLIAIDHALDSVIVSVCDQPLLTLENISNLMAKYQQTQKPVIASRYSGMPGVPALFDKSFFGKLSILSDDQGAKKIILQHRTDVSEVDFPGGEIDLDTMEDYEAFRKREG